MKKVLHVALVAPNGYSNKGLMDAFLNNGFSEYFLFDYQLQSFSIGKDLMQSALIQEADKIKPDIIFLQVQSSEVLTLSTFQTLSRIAFTVNYTFDIRTKDQTEWLYNLAPVLGLICFSNQRDVDECRSRGFNNTMVLQSSADFEIYKPGKEKCNCPCHEEGSGMMHIVACCDGGYVDKKRSGVVFVGNNYVNTNIEFPLSKDRENMVKFLQLKFGSYFEVYGNNWSGSKLTTQKEEVEIYQNAKLAINHNNFDEPAYTSDRLWRIMGTGAFCLTKYFKGIECLFKKGYHLDWWSTLEELNKMVDYYVQVPMAHEIIARRGMEHVRSNHSWTARIKEMMTFIDSKIKVMGKNSCEVAGAHVIDGIIPLPTDEHFNNHICDCGRTRWVWSECGCGEKTFQLRVQENI